MNAHPAPDTPMRVTLRDLTGEELLLVAVLSGKREREAVAHELDRRALSARIRTTPAPRRATLAAACGAA